MKKHIENRSAEQTKCDICDLVFTKSTISGHKTRKHEEAKLFKCPKCDKLLKNKGDFKKHLARHDAKPVQCDMCNVMVKNLRPHNRNVHMHKERRYNCNICDKVLKTKGRHDHMTRHAKKEQKTLQNSTSPTKRNKDKQEEVQQACSICSKKFSEMYLKHHMKNVHIETEKIECNTAIILIIGAATLKSISIESTRIKVMKTNQLDAHLMIVKSDFGIQVKWSATASVMMM